MGKYLSIQDKMGIDAADIKERIARGAYVHPSELKFLASYVAINTKFATNVGKRSMKSRTKNGY